MPLTHRLMLTLAVASALGVGTARAQPNAVPDARTTARARALFREGVTFADQRHWADAADRFRRARALRDAPAIRYNLAAALAEQGLAAEPAELVDGVLADTTTPEPVRAQAQTLRDRLAPRVARVSVTLRGTRPAGARVRIDDRELTAADLGHDLFVEPGPRHVVALDGDRELARRDFVASAGLTTDVVLALTPTARETAEMAESGEHGETDGGGGSLLTDWRFLAVAGAVVVAVVVVVIVVAASGGTEDPIAGNFNPGVITWR